MPGGLPKFANWLATTAAKADDLVVSVSSAQAVVQRFDTKAIAAPTGTDREKALQDALAEFQKRSDFVHNEIDTSPFVIAARAAVADLEKKIGDIEKAIAASAGMVTAAVATELAALRSAKVKADAELADIQVEIDARLAALAAEERRIRAAFARNGGIAAVVDEVDRAVGAMREGADEILRKGEETVTTVERTLRRIGALYADSAAHATRTMTKIEEDGRATERETKRLTYEIFKTLNATEFNVEDYVEHQRELIDQLRGLGLGEYLDVYASAFEKSRRADLSPELGVAYARALDEIRKLIVLLGGKAGSAFNFGVLENDIDRRYREARDAARSGGKPFGGVASYGSSGTPSGYRSGNFSYNPSAASAFTVGRWTGGN